MSAHRTLGGDGLTAPYCAQDVPMLAQDRIAVDGIPDPRDEQRLQDVERPARERTEQLVTRSPGDDLVEARIREPELV